MSKTLKLIVLILAVSSILSSCATICGGSKYDAQIIVPNQPIADIVYRGEKLGAGSGFVRLKRKDANKFSFTVREKGCEPQTYNYTKRAFRGWAFVGTVFWSITSFGYFVPLVTDLADGALWKPSGAESGVVKIDSKTFRYIVNYSGCPVKKEDDTDTVADAKVDIVYLKNGSILKGTLMEPDSPSQIKIQMKDGSIFVYKLDEVLKVE